MAWYFKEVQDEDKHNENKDHGNSKLSKHEYRNIEREKL